MGIKYDSITNNSLCATLKEINRIGSIFCTFVSQINQGGGGGIPLKIQTQLENEGLCKGRSYSGMPYKMFIVNGRGPKHSILLIY